MPAPPFRPHVCAFGLGTFRIATLLDAVDVRSGLAAGFAMGQTETEIRELAAANFIDPDRYEHPFIPIVIDTGSAKILFDTGLGDPESLLLTGLGALGIGAADIDIVVRPTPIPTILAGLSATVCTCFRERAMSSAQENSTSGCAVKVSETRGAPTVSSS